MGNKMAAVVSSSSRVVTVESHKDYPPPSPRSGHRCVSDEANLYVFGGYNPKHEGRIFRELWRFNFATETWHQLDTKGEIPEGAASSSVLLIGHSLILFGGSIFPFSATQKSNIHVCNLKENIWYSIEGEGSTKPVPTYGQSMVLTPEKDRLYIFAGTTGFIFSSDVYMFNFNTNDWTHLPFSRETSAKVPSSRYRHEVVQTKDRFYVIGGGTTSSLSSLKKIYSFRFSDNSWEVHTSLPSKSSGFPSRRLAHSCVLCGDIVYMCGGYNYQDVFDDIWTLDLKNFQWNRLQQTLPVPVYFHSATITPTGCMYIFGGTVSLVGNGRTNELYKVWLTVPSLVELSWQSLLKLLPHRETADVKEMARLGVPQHLLDRMV